LLVDAIVNVGAIKFTLVGFGIGFPLTTKDGKALSFNRLSELSITDFDVHFDGMSVYFNAPPVMIAGFFIKKTDPKFKDFQGGLAVSILPYSLLAVGEYRHQYDPDFKSIFVFGRFDGPLITLEFAEISGVEVGFGRNFALRVPQPKEISNFPLIHGPVGTVSNPIDIMNQFTSFLTPVDGAIWFAIGMKIDSFEVLSVMAAVVIAFQPNGIQASLIGMASAAYPPIIPPPGEKPYGAFFYGELGIVATISYLDDGGSLLVAAQLTPNSFILYPDCHLTGGFAISYWFGGAANAGDWVLTIGGYHSSYQKPAHYPDVDRVGISWNLSDCLTVRGEAYFAVTPKMCMVCYTLFKL
jgi:hypothetical protein